MTYWYNKFRMIIKDTINLQDLPAFVSMGFLTVTIMPNKDSRKTMMRPQCVMQMKNLARLPGSEDMVHVIMHTDQMSTGSRQHSGDSLLFQHRENSLDVSSPSLIAPIQHWNIELTILVSTVNCTSSKRYEPVMRSSCTNWITP